MTPTQIIAAIDTLKRDAAHLGDDVTWHLDAAVGRLCSHLTNYAPLQLDHPRAQALADKASLQCIDAARDYLIAFEVECLRKANREASTNADLCSGVIEAGHLRLAHRACQLSRACEALAREYLDVPALKREGSRVAAEVLAQPRASIHPDYSHEPKHPTLEDALDGAARAAKRVEQWPAWMHEASGRITTCHAPQPAPVMPNAGDESCE